MMQTPLGNQGWQKILYNTSRFRVYEVQLTLNDHAQHNYVFPSDAMLFVCDGQLFIQSTLEESSLKTNQAVWIRHNLSVRCVTVSPSTRFFVIVFLGQTSRENARFERFASGTEAKKQNRNGVTQWTVGDKTSAKIEWHMFPPGHKEPFYYLKSSEQFVVPINTERDLLIEYTGSEPVGITPSGLLIPAGKTRSLINNSDKPITFLSVAAPFPKQSRVLKLSRST
ncbi:hypothetical protein ACFQ45_15890 [Rhodanobacter aciditrophus]|uniref:Uncharacterized protein n=1 Tax=Rhodanobacter aciditrophus TaxID=1623218 RepID=A0ABW4B885_9GAMM